jgi:rRNA maturation endonuclease Nob1
MHWHQLGALFVVLFATVMIVVIFRLLSRIVEEETWCDGCKKYSRGKFCPHCGSEQKE